MRIWIAVALVVVACKDEPRREITKQMNMSNCVRSDDASCARQGGEWNGSQCCETSTCVDGNADACARAGGLWTAKHCCLAKLRTCRAGDEAACAGAGGTWTGALCCGGPTTPSDH